MTPFKYRFCLIVLCGTAAAMAQAEPAMHTPKPGSPERQAICDAVRSFILPKYATGTLPQPIVFRIDRISVQDPYCYFAAIPLFKDGSYIPPNYIADIAYDLCLRKTSGRWTVIVDLSRSDVPDAAEVQEIKRRLPRDFPLSLFSPTWRNLLGGNPSNSR